MENNIEEKEVKVKMSFSESVKFGVGFGAGLFLWLVFLVLAGTYLLGEFLPGIGSGGGGMMY